MEYRNLGRTGLKVSTICLGTMQFGWTADEKNSHAILSRSAELGCNFIDSADIYSRWVDGNRGGESEEMIGRWLVKKVVPRHQLVLATKARGKMGDSPNDEGLSRAHLIHSAEQSLRRLQTDYIDLYQLHWPDQETALEETLSALDALVKSGKVRYVGCSNYPAWLVMKALWISDVRHYVRLETVQPHYNYVHRAEFERELQPVCSDQKLGVIPYSPLAGGFLTGKYQRNDPLPITPRAQSINTRYFNDRGFAAIEKLLEVGNSYKATIAQTALAWLLANPTVTSAIIGANSITQLEETMQGARITLSAEDKTALDAVTAWHTQNF